jgi:hypothetical protein
MKDLLTTIRTTKRLTLAAAKRWIVPGGYDSSPHAAARRALLRCYKLHMAQRNTLHQHPPQDTVALDVQSPNRKPPPPDPLLDDLSRHTRENARLKAHLATAETLSKIQKNLSHSD